MISLLSLHQIVTNELIKQNDIQRKCAFQNVCLDGTGKVAVSACVISSDVRHSK